MTGEHLAIVFIREKTFVQLVFKKNLKIKSEAFTLIILTPQLNLNGLKNRFLLTSK